MLEPVPSPKPVDTSVTPTPAGREVIARGNFLQLEAGPGVWERVVPIRGFQAVGIYALTEKREILLLEQLRPNILEPGDPERWVIEFPSGAVGDHPENAGEDLSTAAVREFCEETGYFASELIYAGWAPSAAAISGIRIHFFVAAQVRLADSAERLVLGTEDEKIRLHRVPLDRIDSWVAERVASGSIPERGLGTGLRILERFARDGVVLPLMAKG